MTQYASPGVYVKEIPSAVQPIAGVSTSTAAFIGIVPSDIIVPTSPVITVTEEDIKPQAVADKKTYNIPKYPKDLDPQKHLHLAEFRVDDKVVEYASINSANQVVVFKDPPPANAKVDGYYVFKAVQVTNEVLGIGDANKTAFPLEKYPVIESSVQVRVNGVVLPAQKADGSKNYTIAPTPNTNPQKRQVQFTTPPTQGQIIACDYIIEFPTVAVEAQAKEVKLCTNFGDFKKYFGDFSTNLNQRRLAHAVYGFFNNGGTRCYVARVDEATVAADVVAVLEKFEAIDEISLVAAPGITDSAVRAAIDAHCQNTRDRFAILDCEETIANFPTIEKPPNTNYAAFYAPWIQVFDPVEKTQQPKSDGYLYVPPSGHIAGIYARVDTQRGVHKAPANEPILGALGLKYKISKSQQDGMNPQGINCIRELNGNIRVWGARTIGGDAQGEWKYISTRRLFLFLRDSIDKNLQWTVFEPNDSKLWAKIRRNITAFLTGVWRDGALFGNTPGEAFYVKCDEETNPPDLRELGQVVTEIGVAVTKPAEFVIFKISQWAGPKG